ncbi:MULTISPECIES: OsmC family protein [Protofrankia]|uniref:OsmC family protein n=1 Tax=Protofrankia coriariae TaxID=1562887 RepID=A0ABR5EZV2_9ACTN|nr:MULTISPECIES: OsmC family protein [Protofrankia]KLL09984.1 OsmC family protein [Protofrankia coriariae]ONH33276.1 osmotically inducible protein OsmC [Protofrankia sp. BMG5.30]
MSGLSEYLIGKRDALLAHRERVAAGDVKPLTVSATVTAEGRTGVRRIRAREFQIISDSGPDLAGHNLGPTSPEIQLGVLGSCLTHTYLIQAATLGVPLDSLDIDVTATFDPRAGEPGYEDLPVYPHDLRYAVRLSSPASDEEISGLREAVERTCPILNLLINPQPIQGTLERVPALP